MPAWCSAWALPCFMPRNDILSCCSAPAETVASNKGRTCAHGPPLLASDPSGIGCITNTRGCGNNKQGLAALTSLRWISTYRPIERPRADSAIQCVTFRTVYRTDHVACWRNAQCPSIMSGQVAAYLKLGGPMGNTMQRCTISLVSATTPTPRAQAYSHQ